MIIAIGIDIIDVERIARSLKTYKGRFREKYFTPSEIEYCSSKKKPSQHYAVRFAAKEAAFKALGEPWHEGTGHRDIEVLSVDDNPPRLVFSEKLHDAFVKKGMLKTHISLSHTSKTAVAVVIIEG